MFYIRADANNIIATGHIMRCLSIADALKQNGIDTTFITADNNASELIQTRGYKIFCLDSKWNDMITEIAKLERYIVDNEIERILVDSYYATDEYLSQLTGVTEVIYLDDLGIIKYPVNKLINYNIYAKDVVEYDLLSAKGTQCYLGTEYAPLREEFRNIKPEFRIDVNNILITTGGTDSYKIALKLVELITKIPKLKQCEYHIISGMFNISRIKLREYERLYDNIHVYENVRNMSELMLKCDIAISASGSTMYELCACAVPVISFSMADNQVPIVDGFAKAGVAIACGDARDGVNELAERIVDEVIFLMNNVSIREKMSDKARQVVDGIGALRIAQCIEM